MQGNINLFKKNYTF